MNITYSYEELPQIVLKFVDFIEHKKTDNKSLVIGFSGDLGAGKTTFTKELLKQFNFSGNVISPTFVLRRDYSTDKYNVIHIDAYRLENKDHLFQIISKEELSNPKNIIIIEWPEKVDSNIFDFICNFSHVSEDVRNLNII